MSDNDYALAMDMPNADTKAEEIPAYKVSQLLEMYTYYRSQALTPAEATRNTANYCRVRLATAERYCGDIG